MSGVIDWNHSDLGSVWKFIDFRIIKPFSVQLIVTFIYASHAIRNPMCALDLVY